LQDDQNTGMQRSSKLYIIAGCNGAGKTTASYPICDNWFVIDNMDLSPEVIAEGSDTLGKEIFNNDIWETILSQRYES
jgi:predicted ABC-type ATPase